MSINKHFCLFIKCTIRKDNRAKERVVGRETRKEEKRVENLNIGH